MSDQGQRIYYSIELPAEVAKLVDITVSSEGAISIRWKQKMRASIDFDDHEACSGVFLQTMIIHARKV